jgi:hypothetical protein
MSYRAELRTYLVVWFGEREPDWDDEEWEEEEFSLRIVKNRTKGKWSIPKTAKKS